MIALKRIYKKAAEEDGFRILVDRVWPRGVSKANAQVDLWLKEIAPSKELRKWFGHDPAKWEAFKERYKEELKGKPELVQEVLTAEREHGTVTLLFAARDEKHNNAVALKEYLEENA